MTAADPHLQIFDNYIESTSIRLRSIRIPETKEWTRLLEKSVRSGDNNPTALEISQIFFDGAEYEEFVQFKGREIRKNRYETEFGGRQIDLDIYLGDLWGLNIANVTFDDPSTAADFRLPDFAVLDVTGREFFDGVNLVGKVFEDVQEEFGKIKGG